MKLLVFAHTPPPHHGQSFMVELMLAGFGGDARAATPREPRALECYHVNCRVSDGMDDIGSLRCGKFFRLLGYCMEALWCRFRHGVRTLYYIPAPGKRSALYRDWVVMALCRPFFKNLVLHWHASGLGEWLEKEGHPLERWITRTLLGRPALSIPLAQASSQDALWMRSLRTSVVPNGIPDPCPEFTQEVLPCRKARIQERERRLQQPADSGAPLVFRVLHLAHCTRQKGLFDSLEGIAIFNARHSQIQAHFTVAGAFMTPQEEEAFHERIARPDLAGAVTYAGFVAGPEKKRLLEETDCLCFPTFHPPESFPLTIVEALAFGIPTVATRWRAIPEILPPDYPGFVAPEAPEEIAGALDRLATTDCAEALRARYLARFSVTSHLAQLGAALKALE